jgi:protein involved in polysaccharide export with SLBB domain/capsular polysaccharide biosynthesis protein
MNGHNGHSGNHADMDGASGAARDYDRGRSSTTSRRRTSATGAPVSSAPARDDKPSFSFDAGSLLRPAAKRWYWLLFGAMAGALAGALLGLSMWKIGYSATAQLVRHEAPITGDAYRPQLIRGETLMSMAKSPEVMRRAAEKLGRPLHEVGSVNAVPERQSDIVNVFATGIDPRSAVELANAFNTAFIEYTQENQRQEAIAADKYNSKYMEDNEADLARARKLLPANLATTAIVTASAEGSAPVTISPKKIEQIREAEEELNNLLVQYTDIHPKVKAQRMKIAQLRTGLPEDWSFEKALAAARERTGEKGDGAADAALTPGGPSREEMEIAFANVRTYEHLRNQLTARQRAIQIFKESPPGNFRVLQPATMDGVGIHKPWVKVALVAAFLGMLGFVLAGGEVLRREIFDNRLKTEADVARVTGLPVLATLGDVNKMSLAEQESWAFRTWIALQDRLAYSPNHGLICGFTSSNPGDGRTTWIGLLAGAARKCGFRVLTIATRSTAEAPAMSEENVAHVQEPVVVGVEEPVHAGAAAETNGHAHVNGNNGSASSNGSRHHGTTTVERGNGRTTAILSNPAEFGHASRGFNGDSEFTALTASALFTPAMVTEKLMGPETDPLVHIPLPGWTWNLERRKQWQGALNVWRKIDNVVILVELPPASMPESVLLASNLPNLVWLSESGKSDATATRSQLETLRHARCNLVGAVINRALTPVTQGRFSRWVGCFALFALLGLAGQPSLLAGEPPRATQSPQVSEQAANAAFGVMSPSQRAQWQQKLTLGPGDVLSFSLYGDPESLREEVPIGPDGRISYLEAQNIMAAGLTVDEFRDRLNEELGKFRRAPQAFVVPVSFKSKKYFVLGRVAQRGAFALDRPVTLVEAVARAGGMETGMAADRSMIELADLSRSFLARNGQRLPIDFEKLFLHGDLSQNVPLEPNDYIYFPAGGEKEVYVLGAVRAPGAHVYHTSVGAVGAIAGRGGFNERAWHQKVLVIRGGLGRPQPIAVDAREVLSGQKPDVILQPRDIVFVSDRPWIYAEELLDAAANAFVTSAVVTWTGEKVTREN